MLVTILRPVCDKFISCLISTSIFQQLLVGSFSSVRNDVFPIIYVRSLRSSNPICMGADPFADAKGEDSGAGTKDYVHVRVQQRNGRKSLTTVQGLKKEFSYNKILKDLKKEFCCNGTVVQDPELGQVGDWFLCSLVYCNATSRVYVSHLNRVFRSYSFRVTRGKMCQPS